MTALGPRLAHAWIGYHRRVQERLTAAGFEDQNFPDGLILRLARRGDTTISDIGRELGITRQGASKLVAGLRERGYVELEKSTVDGRGKVVRPTPHARARLAAAREARRVVDAEIRTEIGDDAFQALETLAALLTDPTDSDAADLRRGEWIKRALNRI